MPPAARVGDLHACPKHVGGPLTDGSPSVNIGGAAAARVGDRSRCQGSQDTIVQGSPTVFIESRPAARSGDRCAHTGVIVTGFPSVIIGNDGSGSTGSGSSAGSGGNEGTSPGGGSTTPLLSGTPVSAQILTSVVSLARQLAAGDSVAPASQSAIQSTATALEVALARYDMTAVGGLTSRLQELLQQSGVKGPAPGKDESADAPSAPGLPQPPSLGWHKPGSIPGEPPRTVAVHEGRFTVNNRAVGIHAISELDLIELQLGGRIEQVVQRLIAASAAGRNCVRIFCMYQNERGRLSPWTTPGYWTAIDALVKRVNAYGMFGEFVLLADCDRRPDGTGGVMPSWDDRRAFVVEAGQFFKGKPVIVAGMNEPFKNGASAADDPKLIEIMRMFQAASGRTVPFSIGDPPCIGDQDMPLHRAAQLSLAAAGASIIVVHGQRQQPDNRQYRWWIDRLTDLGDLRAFSLAGSPYLYHNEPMGFASRREEGRRENDPEAAVAAACVCAIGQMGFCYHRIANEDPATPGLELTRVATLIPQSSDFIPYHVGAEGAPIERFNEDDFPGGTIQTCFNGREAWAVGYGKQVAKTPRVEWRGLAPEVIWRGKRVVLWRAIEAP